MIILPSIGAFIGRVNNRDHRAFLSVCDRIDAEAYEFMMYESFYPNASGILDDFCATGLSFPVFHVEKRLSEYIATGSVEDRREALSRFEANCRAANRLGAGKLVLHLWNGLASDAHFALHLDAFGALDDIARAHGLILTVENVVCAHRDPLYHFGELLSRYPQIAFTYDSKMAAFHEQEYTVFFEAYRHLWDGHIRHVHFNDYNGIPGDFSRLAVLHLGEGNIDIARFAKGLHGVGYDGTVTLECSCMCPDGSLVPEKMNRSLALAHELLDQI